MHRPDVGSESRRISIIWHGNNDSDVVSSRSSLELSSGLTNRLACAFEKATNIKLMPYFEHVFDATAGVTLDNAFYPYQGFDLRV